MSFKIEKFHAPLRIENRIWKFFVQNHSQGAWFLQSGPLSLCLFSLPSFLRTSFISIYLSLMFDKSFFAFIFSVSFSSRLLYFLLVLSFVSSSSVNITYLHTYLSTYLPIYLPTYLHTYLSTYLPTYPPIYLFLYIPMKVYITLYYTYLSKALPSFGGLRYESASSKPSIACFSTTITFL